METFIQGEDFLEEVQHFSELENVLKKFKMDCPKTENLTQQDVHLLFVEVKNAIQEFIKEQLQYDADYFQNNFGNSAIKIAMRFDKKEGIFDVHFTSLGKDSYLLLQTIESPENFFYGEIILRNRA